MSQIHSVKSLILEIFLLCVNQPSFVGNTSVFPTKEGCAVSSFKLLNCSCVFGDAVCQILYV